MPLKKAAPKQASRTRVMSKQSAKTKELKVATNMVQLAVDQGRYIERDALHDINTFLKERPHFILKAKEFLKSEMFCAFCEGRTYSMDEADFPNHRYASKVPRQFLMRFLPDLCPALRDGKAKEVQKHNPANITRIFLAGMRLHARARFGPKQKAAWREAFLRRHRDLSEPLRSISILRNGDIDWRANAIYTLQPPKPDNVEPKNHMYETINAFGHSIDISSERVTAEWNILENWDVVSAKLQGVGRLAGTTLCLDLFPKVVQASATEPMFPSDDESDGESDPEEEPEEPERASLESAPTAATPPPHRQQKRKQATSDTRNSSTASTPPSRSPTVSSASKPPPTKRIAIPGVQEVSVAAQASSWVQDALSTK